MWTLLSAGRAGRNGGRNDVNTPAAAGPRRNGIETPPRNSEVRIYMHPGRLDLGAMDLERADEQFDLRSARPFGSLEEAEPACAGRAGFLLQLPGKSGRVNGAVVRGTVLFVERLRR